MGQDGQRDGEQEGIKGDEREARRREQVGDTSCRCAVHRFRTACCDLNARAASRALTRVERVSHGYAFCCIIEINKFRMNDAEIRKARGLREASSN